MSVPKLSLTRRQFTLGLAGAMPAFPGVGNSLYNPKLAADCLIWLQEPIARKRHPSEILDEAFSSLHRAGYRRLVAPAEILSPEVRNTALARMGQYGLELSIVCISGELHTRDGAEISRYTVLETARLIEGRAAFIAFTPAPKRDGKPKTREELDVQSYQLNQMGQELQHTGVGLMLNHEVREMADDAREWRHAVAHTEARLVSLCIDAETVIRAGVNPWELIDAAGNRLRSVHLRNARHGVEQELLETGDINMPEIAALLRQAHYDGYLVVELRFGPGTPIHRSLPEALAMNRWYVQEVFGSRPGLRPVDMGPHVRIPR